MKRRIMFLALTTAFTVVMASPTRAQEQQATDPADHAVHHPAAPATQAEQPAAGTMAAPMPSTAKLDELLTKMNSATGDAKMAAMAELLTALVQDRRACEPMMAKMMKMMDMMGAAHGTMPMKPAAK